MKKTIGLLVFALFCGITTFALRDDRIIEFLYGSGRAILQSPQTSQKIYIPQALVDATLHLIEEHFQPKITVTTHYTQCLELNISFTNLENTEEFLKLLYYTIFNYLDPDTIRQDFTKLCRKIGNDEFYRKVMSSLKEVCTIYPHQNVIKIPYMKELIHIRPRESKAIIRVMYEGIMLLLISWYFIPEFDVYYNWRNDELFVIKNHWINPFIVFLVVLKTIEMVQKNNRDWETFERSLGE